ncbi:N-acyl-D-amino-acid deacylase family protein [Sanguibacter sp. A247]|uniref:N-acyl-D-amino-acid deacylase family protein n=1 Tax=unclassified Sanguibacter TaxID=2645534 RepID=UPI003FD8EA88
MIIRGARVPEGTGLSDPVDLHVTGDRLTALIPAGTGGAAGAAGAAGTATADQVVDADGRIALPGFIDAHSHAESALFEPDIQLALLRQGVTSVVLGLDGVSFAPDPSGAGWAGAYFAGILGPHPTFRGGSVADLLATYEATTPLNVAYLVPHGTLRHAVLGGSAAPADDTARARIVSLLEEALDDGAVGLSTGLEYVPAAYADRAELEALARAVAERDLVHVSHMRGYEEHAARALGELTQLAVATGVRTHVSHLHGPADEIVRALAAATDAGVDMTFDSYPYLRGCSILSMVALPTWLPLADASATREALAEPVAAARVSAHLATLDDLWPRVTLASVPGELAWAEGRTLLDVAARLGSTPADAALRLLLTSDLRVTCLFEQPPTGTDAALTTLASHAGHTVGSDAIYPGSHPHPRGWATFPATLARMLAPVGPWSWADAVEHLSTRAARAHALARGTLGIGSVADIVLVDEGALAPRATYVDPRVPADGIDDVVVAGVPVLAAGRLTGATPGRALRPQPGGGRT